MIADQGVVQDQRYRRVLIGAILVVVAAVSGFGIGRTTAETADARGAVAEHAVKSISSLGPMSDLDRTRFEVHSKMNQVGPLHPGG